MNNVEQAAGIIEALHREDQLEGDGVVGCFDAAAAAQGLADAGLLAPDPQVIRKGRTMSNLDRVAQAMYAHRQATGDFPDGVTPWEQLPEDWKNEYREAATHLEDHGLLAPDMPPPTDPSVPADKVQEVFDFLIEHAKTEESGDYEIGYANAIQNCLSLLDGIVPKPRTLADELREYAENILAGGSVSDVKRQLILFAARVETLEKERDGLTYAREEGRAAADNWTVTARRLEEAQAEITRLRAREIPNGWRVADHQKHGRGIVTRTTPNCYGRVYFMSPDDALSLGCDWHYCDPADLTFLDTPSPEQEMDAR